MSVMKKKCFIFVVLICTVLLVTTACSNKKEDEKSDDKLHALTESEMIVDTENQTEQEDATEEGAVQESEAVNDSESTETEGQGEIASNSEQTKPEQTPPTTNPTPSKPEQKPSSSESTEVNKPQQPESSESTAPAEEYIVSVVSAGGHKLYNAKVNVYKDKSMKELVTTVGTKSTGIATLQLVPSDNYVFTLTNVPEGYKLNTYYSFNGKTADVVLESSVVTGKDMPSTRLKVGHVMYDFTVPNAEGGEITLSEVLKTKKLVVLNFWYVNCQFCVMEFPYMSSAYNRYANDVEIIALNPFDSMDDVKSFLNENPLPFQIATCTSEIPNVFRIDAYPVSIVIDQYGVIREIEEGAILEENGFVSLFERYL